MSNEFNLNVDKRDLTNKGGRKRALKEGKIPGVYYSHDSKESISFYIGKNGSWITDGTDTGDPTSAGSKTGAFDW